MSKQFSATFKIIQVDTGEVIEEEGPHTCSPLKQIHKHWAEFVEDSPVDVGEVNLSALRVSQSRNDGVGKQTRAFELDGVAYQVVIEVRPVETFWEFEIPNHDTYKAVVRVKDGRPGVFFPGEGWLPLEECAAPKE